MLTRGQDGTLNAWVNRCAHKGASVCRSPRGNSADGTFVCVYHQWSYDSAGKLIGVPFRRGLKGVGGYPGDFDLAEHGLQALKVESLAGMVFGSLAQDPPPLEEFLGEVMVANVRRILHRPIKVLGYARQRMAGNWKLYAENSRDGYHGGLLHLFYPTFGIYRPSQESREDVDSQGYHAMFSISRPKVDIDYESFSQEANREMGGGTAELQDARVIEYRPDMADGISLCIQSLFPSVVLQQIQNTLATRQVVPLDVDSTDLIWTYFGYEDDDEEVTRHRLRNLNLVGPAGFISMEDGEAVEIVQHGISGANETRSFVEMGGDDVRPLYTPIGMDENSVRGFWRGYFGLMKGQAPAAAMAAE